MQLKNVLEHIKNILARPGQLWTQRLLSKMWTQLLSEKNDKEEYQSPEDAYAFGQLLVYMFANWSFAWKLNFFPMPQVER